MHEIKRQSPIMNYVPEPAQDYFLEKMWWWYESLAERDRYRPNQALVPSLSERMMHDCIETTTTFLDFLYECHHYHYVKNHLPKEFRPSVFPVAIKDWMEIYEESACTHWIEEYGEHEYRFVEDMKMYLERNHLFYIDGYSNPNEAVLRNVPIKGVW